MHGQRIGYIRVSTLDQQTELQLVGFRGRRFISMCGSMQESKSKLAPAHGAIKAPFCNFQLSIVSRLFHYTGLAEQVGVEALRPPRRLDFYLQTILSSGMMA